MTTSVDCTGVQGITAEKRVGTSREGGDRVVRVLDGYVGQPTYGVHCSNLTNLCRGVVERVLFTRSGGSLEAPVKPKDGVFSKLSHEFGAVRRNTRSTTVVPLEEYPSLYYGRKRAVYERAVASLSLQAVSKRDAVVRTFVKAEKVNFSAKPDPAPRVIQPRDPRYTASVGRYLKNFEKRMQEGFAKTYNYPVICKGLNAQGTAAVMKDNWDAFDDPVAIGLDASRFDQHVSRQALVFEHKFYNSVFKSPELAQLLSWQLVNKGVGLVDDGRIKYTVEGCRMSGDINTSMGNCFIMCCIVLAYFREAGLVARLSNNGDDCVVFCERRDLNKLEGISGWFEDFGFRLTREPTVDIFERIEFCQAQPVLTTTGWRMVRNPYIATSKDMVSLLPWGTEVQFDQWRGAISTCGLNLTRGVPFWARFYERLGGVSSDSAYDRIMDSGLGYMSHGMDCAAEISPEARYSFWLAFGMTPDEQEALESLDVGVAYGESTPLTFGDVTPLHPLLRVNNGAIH